jgi:hypothetical protein
VARARRRPSADRTPEGRGLLSLKFGVPTRVRIALAGSFLLLLIAFAAGLWGTLIRPSAYEVRGEVVARPAPDMILIKHDAVGPLGMGPMDLMAVVATPEALDAADPRPGDRVRLAVRSQGDRLVLVRIERLK